ncbi:hypothetical protein GGR58DRAFT_505341 [Xylaria digitata]|nr:hypothetical protein GGR58DRAFT_505341 [Xylaria digitata]
MNSIADMTRSCLEGARQSIQRLEGKEKIHMQTLLADLRLWADSVGAIAQSKASLDRRFQYRPHDVYLIERLLLMLQGFFNECSVAADKNTNIEDIMSNINSTVDSLAIVGVQIRQSGRESRLRKADSTFDKNRGYYYNFRAHLACIIAAKPAKDGWSKNEDKLIHSVEYFANLKLTPIQERLIEANMRRRHRFLEAQRRSYGLQAVSTEAYQSTISRQTVAEPSDAKQTPVDNLSAQVQGRPTDPPITIVTSASALDSNWDGLQDSHRPGSTATHITTITANARYPKARIPSEQKLAKCPCCCQAIPANQLVGSQWRKHLASDINPYTCILEKCPTPYNLFATHYEWKDHVMNDHPSQWHCPRCSGEAPVFKSLSGVMNHIMLRHPDAVSGGLEDLLSDAEVKVMGITECPLCDSEGPQDSPDLIEHVLQHIHDFSLRSLPWPADSTFGPSKPVATFDKDYAANIHKDDEGNEYSFPIAEWAESVAPKKWDSGEISVLDAEGNELILDMTKYPQNMTPDSGPLLQLCNLDRNPPKINEIEPALTPQFNIDYFSRNLYFMEESSDSWSSSQSLQPSEKAHDIGALNWICTLCGSRRGQGDGGYFQHMEDSHREVAREMKDSKRGIEKWVISRFGGAYFNGM